MLPCFRVKKVALCPHPIIGKIITFLLILTKEPLSGYFSRTYHLVAVCLQVIISGSTDLTFLSPEFIRISPERLTSGSLENPLVINGASRIMSAVWQDLRGVEIPVNVSYGVQRS